MPRLFRRLTELEVGFRKISSEDLDVHFTITGRGSRPLPYPAIPSGIEAPSGQEQATLLRYAMEGR